MLSCKDENRGFFHYRCAHCGTDLTDYFDCNSHICTNCGKNHTYKWAKYLEKALFNVHHRHAVLTIPKVLWPIIRKNRFLHKVLIDAGKKCKDMELDDIREKMNMDFTYEIAEEKIVFTVGNSLKAKALHKCEKPVCHMYRGFFKEISKNIPGPKVNCTEETCMAKGNIECRFVAEV